MLKMKPSSMRKRRIADATAVPFTNPMVGKAMADKAYRELGGKNVRPKKAKNWFRTRY